VVLEVMQEKSRGPDGGGGTARTSRTFTIRTYGCQMNVHDSQKVANLLSHAGYREAASETEADLLVINTCSIREKAEHHLYSDLGALRDWKEAAPGRVLGVGGCVAQQVGDGLLARFPQLDFVFGTHNLRYVPALAEAALHGQRVARTSETTSPERFALPDLHPNLALDARRRAFVTVMEGCDMFCSFCIVPLTRGREVSRPASAILDEVRALAARGVREVTLLGQTVNAYGRHEARRGSAAAAGTVAFAALLREIDAIPGIERIRFTSPHPLFFDDALVSAYGELEHLCPHVHLPVQSGSDRVLEAMHRRYTRARYEEIVARLRAVRPDIALTTDLIVGFPGESEDDFAETLGLLRGVGFVDHYSFKYSPRPGTRAASAPIGALVPPDVAQERLERLQDAQRELSLAYHRGRVGTTTRVLIDGPSRKGGRQLCGRDPYHRVVNFDPSGAIPAPGPGDVVEVELVEALPHSLVGALARAAWQPTRAPSRIDATL